MLKFKKSIEIDCEIDFLKYVKGVLNCRYVLKSVVCYYGWFINFGYYMINFIVNNLIVKVSDVNVFVGFENEM